MAKAESIQKKAERYTKQGKLSIYECVEIYDILHHHENTTVCEKVAKFLKNNGFNVVEEGIGFRIIR